jgi:hypothetical protein
VRRILGAEFWKSGGKPPHSQSGCAGVSAGHDLIDLSEGAGLPATAILGAREWEMFSWACKIFG